MTCTTCQLGLHHCHGVLVEHEDGTTTCLDGCAGPRAVHDLLVACADVDFGCCDAPDGGERLPLDEPAPAWAA